MIGVEPILQESKSRVLPLHHIPIALHIISYFCLIVNIKEQRNLCSFILFFLSKGVFAFLDRSVLIFITGNIFSVKNAVRAFAFTVRDGCILIKRFYKTIR